MFRLVVLSITLIFSTAGCQSWTWKTQASSPNSKGNAQSGSTYSLEDQQRQKNQQILKAPELYNIFAREKRIKSRKGQEDSIQIYDLTCELDPQAEAVKCSGYTMPEWIKGAVKIDFSKAHSEQIFATLLSLPIAKGESGLTTEAIVCRQVTIPSQEANTYCAVMAPIDFIPHSPIPSGH